MSKVVMDASCLLALIKDEPGAKAVEQLLGNIIMSSINVSEVAAVLLDSEMTQEECRDSIEPFIGSIIPFCETQAFIAASLKRQTKRLGLSLGDRACIALGIKTGLKVYTADKVWKDLEIKGVDIKFIR